MTAVQDFIDIDTIKEAYQERLTLEEELFHGENLIKLQLIETEKEEGYAANWQRGQNDAMPAVDEKTEKLKRTPINYADIFNSKSVKKKVRRVLVEGDAGTGKTIFCAKTAEDWANEDALQQFELLLHFPLRDKEVASAKSIEDLIKYLDESIDTVSKEELHAINNEKVLIILDGWDELDESDRQKGSFMYKLVTRKHLSRASLLVTSRPSASASLHKLRCIDRCIEIVGFSKEDVKEFIEAEFADYNPQKAADLLEQLNKKPLVASLCSIPLNCAIICQLWRNSEDDQLPATMSGLYRNIILNIVLRDIHRKFPEYKDTTPALQSFDSIPDDLKSLLWNLCEFAFYAIEKNQQLFSIEELPDTMKKDDFKFGLLQQADTRQSGVAGRVPSFHFLHLTFQEYLAALHLAKQPPNAQIRACHIHANSKRFHKVWRFLFGISYAPMSVSSQISSLSNTVVVSVLQMLMEKRALLCHCALEANNSEVSFEVAEALKGNYEAHTAHDCVAVATILSDVKVSTNLRVDFDNSDLCDNGIAEVAKLLAQNAAELRVSELSLRSNKLTSEGIANMFSQAPNVFQYSLMVLDVSGNMVNNASSIIMTLSCSILDMLDLSGCPLGESGIQSFVDVVCNRKLPNLSTLWLVKSLSSNPDVNATLLASLALCSKLCALDISENHLSQLELRTLANTLSRIAKNNRPITLGLRKTMLGFEGVRVFVDNLVGQVYFAFLSIEDNSISSSSLSILADSVSNGTVTVKSFFLDGNPIGLDGVSALSRLICNNTCNIEAYSIKKCHLSEYLEDSDSKEPPHLTAKMVGRQLLQMPQCTSRIKYLYFDKNIFMQESIHILVGLLHLCPYVDFLHCKRCGITSKDLQNLLTQLSQTQSFPSATDFNYVWKWLLTGNAIDDSGVDTLIDNLSHLFPRIANVVIEDNPNISDDKVAKLEETLKEVRKCAENWRIAEHVSSKVINICETDIQNSSKVLPGGHCDEVSWRNLISRFILFTLIHYPNVPLTVKAVDIQLDAKSEAVTLPLLKNVFCTGLRVVRGPDWQSADEDGGEGCIGTVMEISEPAICGGRLVLVQWDSGNTGHYRCGVEGKFDLRMLDNAPSGLEHRYVACDSCDEHPLRGMRWKCIQCWDFDLCTTCYMAGQQIRNDSLRHTFIRFDTINQQVLRVQVGPRIDAMKMFQRETSFDLKFQLLHKKGFHYMDHLPVLGHPYPQPTQMLVEIKKDHNGEFGYEFNDGSQWGYFGALVTYIAPGSATDRKGTIAVGDRILEVNGESLLGKSFQEIKSVLDLLSDLEIRVHLIERDGDRLAYGNKTKKEEETDHGIKIVPRGRNAQQHAGQELSERELEVECLTPGQYLRIGDLKTVRTAIWDARAKWYNLGIELDIPVGTLDAIKLANFHQPDDCVTAMIKEWLQSPAELKCTWEALVEATKSPIVDNPSLALEIEKKYCT